jgi:hypothetical protein
MNATLIYLLIFYILKPTHVKPIVFPLNRISNHFVLAGGLSNASQWRKDRSRESGLCYFMEAIKGAVCPFTYFQ